MSGMESSGDEGDEQDTSSLMVNQPSTLYRPVDPEVARRAFANADDRRESHESEGAADRAMSGDALVSPAAVGMLNDTAEEQEVGGGGALEGEHMGLCTAMKDMPSTLRWAACFAALGGILFGYDIGIISGALLQLEEEFELTAFKKELVVSLMLVGAIFGSIFGGHIIDAVGRRKAIIGNAVLFVVGAIGLASAKDLTTLLIARVVVGFAVALSAIAECVYISEIAPAAHRGALVSLNELGITVGIFLSYMVNYALITTDGGWRWMFGLSTIPAILQGIGMVFMPASPRWLLLRGFVAEAEAALRKFRAPTHHDSVQMAATVPTGVENDADPIREEIANIRQNLAAQQNAKTSDLIRDPQLRQCMFVGCGIVLFQQFTGQPNVLYYGATICKESGFSTHKQATLAQMVIGLIKVIATCFAIAKVDHLGRRKLLLWGTTAMIASLLVLATVTAVAPPAEMNGTDDGMFEELADNEGRLRRSDMAMSMLSPFPWAYEYTDAAPDWEEGDFEQPGFEQGVPVGSFEDPHAMYAYSRVIRSSAHHRHSQHGSEQATTAIKWISFISLICFVVAYAFSYGPVSWLVLSEIFPDDIRGRAVAIATIFNWGSNLIVSATFLSLMEEIGAAGTFFLYTAVGCIALLFIYVYVPETKGATLEQIQQIFRDRNPKKVWRDSVSILSRGRW